MVSYDYLPFKGGPENSQLVSGNTNSFDILNLEGGVSYTVKVTALIGSREGEPVSIIVTTRKTHIHVFVNIFVCYCSKIQPLFKVVGDIVPKASSDGKSALPSIAL